MRLYDPKRILVPVDLSLMSKEVLRVAIEIGKHRDAGFRTGERVLL